METYLLIMQLENLIGELTSYAIANAETVCTYEDISGTAYTQIHTLERAIETLKTLQKKEA